MGAFYNDTADMYNAILSISAVFFIPYVIMLFFVGMPIFFLELSLGQYTRAGPLTCWEMAPLFKGICLKIFKLYVLFHHMYGHT